MNTQSRIYNLLMISPFIFAGFGTISIKAQGMDARDMPLSFDLRESIPKPDLSKMARIRFLTMVDFLPFNFIDPSSKLSGFHVDLLREICRELDMTGRCQIAALPFEKLQRALASGDAEIIAAGVAITPQLREKFLFSRLFFQLPAHFAAQHPKTTLESFENHPVGVGHRPINFG